MINQNVYSIVTHLHTCLISDKPKYVLKTCMSTERTNFVTDIVIFNEIQLLCYLSSKDGPLWVLGIWGEGLSIVRELETTGNYFRGAGE